MLDKTLYQLRRFRPELARWPEGVEPRTWFASDGVALHGYRVPGRGPYDLVAVHGLLGNHGVPAFQAMVLSLTRFGDVYAFDLRGHGLSGGSCTLGNREALDVAAVTEEVRRDRPLVVIGSSMGAVAVMRAAALLDTPDAVVAISAPATWEGPRGSGARRTSLLWKVPGARAVLRAATGVSLAAWEDCESPAEVVNKIAPSGVLIVHGTEDDFFPVSEAETNFAAAGEPKDMWIIEGGGHAEGVFGAPWGWPIAREVDGFVDEVMRRVGRLIKWAR